MEGATDYEDQGSLKNPVNQVVAVFAPEIDTEEVVRLLHQAGKRREIADLLKLQGATYINSYGMFSIEGLG